jgi:hypothetical protein
MHTHDDEKPDFHMKGLQRSECAKEAGELTVVRLGYVTTLQEEAYTAGYQKAVEDCIKLSDEIEHREPDGGTKQWMAFKAFRNTMRDTLAAKKK